MNRWCFSNGSASSQPSVQQPSLKHSALHLRHQPPQRHPHPILLESCTYGVSLAYLTERMPLTECRTLIVVLATVIDICMFSLLTFKVTLNAGLCHTLWKHDSATLNCPINQNLSRGFSKLLCNLNYNIIIDSSFVAS